DLANAGMAFLPVFGVIIIFKIFVGGKSLMTHLQSPVNQPNQVQGPSGNPPAHRPQMGRVPFRGISMVRPSNPPPPQRPPQP
ncbi:MAG: hypothetical protein SFY92_02405, partial [Verrucomicrobiae bacterium]|nr:hypothetical protein [Verrucomicrobiae bacterium]